MLKVISGAGSGTLYESVLNVQVTECLAKREETVFQVQYFVAITETSKRA